MLCCASWREHRRAAPLAFLDIQVIDGYVLSGVFQGLPEPTKPTAPRPLLSLYGIIYVTWYTSGLPEATGVRLRLPNSHALLGSGRPCKTPLCFLAVLDPRVGHTMESCPRIDVVHPGRAWSSSPSCTLRCSLHYLFL